MERTFLIAAAIMGFLGVAMGAFGAHALEATLKAHGRKGTFETATQYHMYHALAGQPHLLGGLPVYHRHHRVLRQPVRPEHYQPALAGWAGGMGVSGAGGVARGSSVKYPFNLNF